MSPESGLHNSFKGFISFYKYLLTPGQNVWPIFFEIGTTSPLCNSFDNLAGQKNPTKFTCVSKNVVLGTQRVILEKSSFSRSIL